MVLVDMFKIFSLTNIKINNQNVKWIKENIGEGEKKSRWGWVIIDAFRARTARDAKNKKKWKKINKMW
jgi:hypothetical protein